MAANMFEFGFFQVRDGSTCSNIQCLYFVIFLGSKQHFVLRTSHNQQRCVNFWNSWHNSDFSRKNIGNEKKISTWSSKIISINFFFFELDKLNITIILEFPYFLSLKLYLPMQNYCTHNHERILSCKCSFIIHISKHIYDCSHFNEYHQKFSCIHLAVANLP